jgi:hypothetical protein
MECLGAKALTWCCLWWCWPGWARCAVSGGAWSCCLGITSLCRAASNPGRAIVCAHCSPDEGACEQCADAAEHSSAFVVWAWQPQSRIMPWWGASRLAGGLSFHGEPGAVNSCLLNREPGRSLLLHRGACGLRVFCSGEGGSIAYRPFSSSQGARQPWSRYVVVAPSCAAAMHMKSPFQDIRSLLLRCSRQLWTLWYLKSVAQLTKGEIHALHLSLGLDLCSPVAPVARQ